MDEHGTTARRTSRGLGPDERLVLWGLLGFFGLGLYAALMVAVGMWLTP